MFMIWTRWNSKKEVYSQNILKNIEDSIHVSIHKGTISGNINILQKFTIAFFFI